MTDSKPTLTEPQQRLLARIARHGLKRRRFGKTLHHWVPEDPEVVHKAPLERLFAHHFLRVVSLGLPDLIEVSDAGRKYLAQHEGHQ